MEKRHSGIPCVTGFFEREPLELVACVRYRKPLFLLTGGPSPCIGFVSKSLQHQSWSGASFSCYQPEIKGYRFEVLLPEGLSINGAVLSTQVKSLDWKIRQAEFICRLPASALDEVLRKLNTFLGL